MSTNSNAYKSIFANKDKKTVGVGKDEFLARRRFFLEMAQNDNKSVKKAPSSNHITSRYTSNLKPEPKFKPIKSTSNASFSKDPSSTASNKTSNKTPASKSSTTNLRPTYTKLPENAQKTITGSAGFSSPKSNSLKNILSQVGRNNQFVSNDEFRSRRKAFEDAQLNDITQLLPRPLTPSGYCYYGRSSPLLGNDRPWSPASERPWSPAYERHGSPTPSFDSERSFGASEVRLPWERPTQNKKTTATKTPAKEEKKVFTTPAVPGSPALSATPITSDEPMAIPITDDIIITPPPEDSKAKDELLNEKLKMWYSKVDKEIEKENAEVNKAEE